MIHRPAEKCAECGQPRGTFYRGSACKTHAKLHPPVYVSQPRKAGKSTAQRAAERQAQKIIDEGKAKG